MNAVMMTPLTDQWRNLEPEGLGHTLLVEWAAWYRDGRAPGDENASWSVKERLDPVHDGEPPDSAKLVEEIVKGIMSQYPHYGKVLRHFYLGEKAIWVVARDIRQTEGWTRTMLLAAAGLVERRYQGIDY